MERLQRSSHEHWTMIHMDLDLVLAQVDVVEHLQRNSQDNDHDDDSNAQAELQTLHVLLAQSMLHLQR
jgi:hypothetical protein